MQPQHLLDDAVMGMGRLGRERAKRAFLMASVVGNGSTLVLGSDWTVGVAKKPTGGMWGFIHVGCGLWVLDHAFRVLGFRV